MVINVGALKSGDLRIVEQDIEAVTTPCRESGALSKVIIEAALLTDDEKITACTLAKAAGADYVKTSTGFASGGATAADVALMRRIVGAEMGVKAAGGVRDLEGMKAMIAAGASRVGASAGVKIVQQSRGEKTSAAPAGYRGQISIFSFCRQSMTTAGRIVTKTRNRDLTPTATDATASAATRERHRRAVRVARR